MSSAGTSRTSGTERPPPQGIPIHIDTDPGVDDLLALAVALVSPELRVVGITTVAGNAPIEAVTDNAQRFLALAGVRVPVARGAAGPLRASQVTAVHVHGRDGRGGVALPAPNGGPPLEPEEVFRGSLERGEARILLALGPLTNVAELIRRAPELLRQVEIVWMGGTLGTGNVTPVAEFNCYADPDAAAEVLGSGIPIRVVGLDVTHQAVVRQQDLPTLPFGDSPRGRVLEELLSSLMRACEGVEGSSAVLHDPCAVAAIAAPEHFRFEGRALTVPTTEGKDRGRLIPGRPGASRVRYAMSVEGKAVTSFCLERLRRFANAGADGANL